MFQPVGGMDRIPYAFARSLGEVVRYNSRRSPEIRKTANGVRVSYRTGESGPVSSVEADYCICAMPLTVLKTIPNDFAPRVKSAIEQVTYDSAYKVAWGVSTILGTGWRRDLRRHLWFLTTGPINMVWYPTAKLMSKRGVLISGYGMENWSDFGKLPNQEAKISASRAAVEKLHPGKSKELEKPIYMCWGKTPYNMGSWVSRGPDYPASDDGPYYQGAVQRGSSFPTIEIYFAGDHCSHLIGWQEGAALAAQRAITMIVSRVSQS